MGTDVGIGILLFRQRHHADVHPLLEHHVDPPEGSLDARGITVVQDGDIRRKPSDEADLVLGEGGSRAGDDIPDSGLVHGEHVGIAFHEDAFVFLHDGVTGMVDPVEGGRFMVDVGFGRVDVLGGLGVAPEDAPAEADDPAREAVDGEHHPAGEAVGQPVGPFDAQAGLEKELILVATLAGFRDERVALLGRVAELEPVDDLAPEPAFLEIAQPDVHALIGFEEHPDEIFPGKLVEDHHGLPVVLLLQLLGRLLGFDDIDMIFFRQPAKGFGIAEVLVLHQEVDRVAALPASEALVDAPRRRHVKGGRFLVVERAEPDEVRPAFADVHEIAHHLRDLGGLDDALDGGVVDHGTKVAKKDGRRETGDGRQETKRLRD